MAIPLPFGIYDAGNIALAGVAGDCTVTAYDARTLAPRTPPAVVESAPKVYTVTPTDDDENTGTVIVVKTGHFPDFVVLEASRSTSQFFAWAALADVGGPAPSNSAWANESWSGVDPAPAVTSPEAGVFVACPTTRDIAAGAVGSYVCLTAEPYRNVVGIKALAAPTPALAGGPGIGVLYPVIEADPKLAGITFLFGGENLEAHKPAPSITVVPQLEDWTPGKKPNRGYDKARRCVGTLMVQALFRLWGVAQDETGAVLLSASSLEHQRATEALRNRFLAVLHLRFTGLHTVNSMRWLGDDGSALGQQGRAIDIRVSFEVPVYEDEVVSDVVKAPIAAVAPTVRMDFNPESTTPGTEDETTDVS